MTIHHTVKDSRCSFTATYKTLSDMVNFVIGYNKMFCFVFKRAKRCMFFKMGHLGI